MFSCVLNTWSIQISSLSACTAEIANAFPQTCKQNWVLHFPAENVKTICSVVNLEHCVGRSFNREKEEEEEEIPEYLRLHQLVVRRIGEMCRIVNQVKNSLFTISIKSGPLCRLFWSERPTISGPLPQILNRCFPLFYCLTFLDFLHSASYCRTCMTVACATLS